MQYIYFFVSIGNNNRNVTTLRNIFTPKNYTKNITNFKAYINKHISINSKQNILIIIF